VVGEVLIVSTRQSVHSKPYSERLLYFIATKHKRAVPLFPSTAVTWSEWSFCPHTKKRDTLSLSRRSVVSAHMPLSGDTNKSAELRYQQGFRIISSFLNLFWRSQWCHSVRHAQRLAAGGGLQESLWSVLRPVCKYFCVVIYESVYWYWDNVWSMNCVLILILILLIII
jgi:hypothetical protein